MSTAGVFATRSASVQHELAVPLSRCRPVPVEDDRMPLMLLCLDLSFAHERPVTGELRCSLASCDGSLHPATVVCARARTVRIGPTTVQQYRPRRGRYRSCQVSEFYASWMRHQQHIRRHVARPTRAPGGVTARACTAVQSFLRSARSAKAGGSTAGPGSTAQLSERSSRPTRRPHRRERSAGDPRAVTLPLCVRLCDEGGCQG